MCECSQAEFSNLILIILGAIISAGVGYIASILLFVQTRRKKALDDFVNTFIEPIMRIEEVKPTKDNAVNSMDKSSISTFLFGYKATHRKAILVYSFYISRNKSEQIKKAYDNYYDPLGIDGSPNDILYKSMYIYDESMKVVNANERIKRNISGRDLALENIKKIIEAAK